MLELLVPSAIVQPGMYEMATASEEITSTPEVGPSVSTPFTESMTVSQYTGKIPSPPETGTDHCIPSTEDSVTDPGTSPAAGAIPR